MEEIRRVKSKYRDRLSDHVNPLGISLLDETDETICRQRFHAFDLSFVSIRNNIEKYIFQNSLLTIIVKITTCHSYLKYLYLY